ncbi:MAG: hypothetical protein ABI182_04195 [Candidatus Baltobacteraceae bacterium]
MEVLVEIPMDLDALLQALLSERVGSAASTAAIVPDTEAEATVLSPEDEAYFSKLVAAVRAGKKAVVIVEDSDEKLKYMFSNAARAEAVSMLGKVIEATGRRLASGDS